MIIEHRICIHCNHDGIVKIIIPIGNEESFFNCPNCGEKNIINKSKTHSEPYNISTSTKNEAITTIQSIRRLIN
jgi:predicted RNA-binding Zn-ribbon protein involved in translation (DUF1610 family)